MLNRLPFAFVILILLVLLGVGWVMAYPISSLVVNGQINRVKAFSTTSSSKTIRNGVGIRKDGDYPNNGNFSNDPYGFSGTKKNIQGRSTTAVVKTQ
jgi:uncharacterized protein (UPF0333 family)